MKRELETDEEEEEARGRTPNHRADVSAKQTNKDSKLLTKYFDLPLSLATFEVVVVATVAIHIVVQLLMPLKWNLNTVGHKVRQRGRKQKRGERERSAHSWQPYA